LNSAGILAIQSSKIIELQLRDSVGLAPIFPRYLRWLFSIRTESVQYITPIYSC